MYVILLIFNVYGVIEHTVEWTVCTNKNIRTVSNAWQ